MHMCICALNAERIPLYTVNLPFSFNNLVRFYAPCLYAVMDGVPMDAEEFGGFSDRKIVLALLCALCAVLSHDTMLDPSETPRKALEAIVVAVMYVSLEWTRTVCPKRPHVRANVPRDEVYSGFQCG